MRYSLFLLTFMYYALPYHAMHHLAIHPCTSSPHLILSYSSSCTPVHPSIHAIYHLNTPAMLQYALSPTLHPHTLSPAPINATPNHANENPPYRQTPLNSSSSSSPSPNISNILRNQNLCQAKVKATNSK